MGGRWSCVCEAVLVTSGSHEATGECITPTESKTRVKKRSRRGNLQSSRSNRCSDDRLPPPVDVDRSCSHYTDYTEKNRKVKPDDPNQFQPIPYIDCHQLIISRNSSRKNAPPQPFEPQLISHPHGSRAHEQLDWAS